MPGKAAAFFEVRRLHYVAENVSDNIEAVNIRIRSAGEIRATEERVSSSTLNRVATALRLDD